MGEKSSKTFGGISSYSSSPSNFLHRRSRNRLSLLSLPNDIILKIILYVGGYSFRDLCRVRAACKTFGNVGKDPFYCKHIDLFNMLIPNMFHKGVLDFIVRCTLHGNLSAMLLRGSTIYFRRFKWLEGLTMIRDSAATGHGIAISAYCNYRSFLPPGTEFDPGFINLLNKKFVTFIKRKMDYVDSNAWNYKLPNILKKEYEETKIGSIFTCQCITFNPFIDPSFPELCESCFWTIHTLTDF